jgi:hypothetical protein
VVSWTIRASNSGKGKTYFSIPKRPDQLWGPTSPLFSGYSGSSSGIKRPGRDVDQSSPPSAEVKNEWSYTSTPIVCL